MFSCFNEITNQLKSELAGKIFAAHHLVVSSRHRAMGDADLLLQFWRVCEATFGKERLLAAVNQSNNVRVLA